MEKILPLVFETCPRCNDEAVLSDDPIGSSIEFTTPLCEECRNAVSLEVLYPIDEAYERARANGWAD